MADIVERLRATGLRTAAEGADTITQLRAEVAERDQFITKLQTALAFWLPHVTEEIEAELNGRAGDDAYLLAGYEGEQPEVTWADSLRQRMKDAEEALARTERNRDMWKGQCERQAIELEAVRRFGGGFFADVVLERTRDHYRKEAARARTQMGGGKDG